MVDQPARGRSPWQPGIDGELLSVTAELIERTFTAPQDFGDWPLAKLHTQSPGSGRIGEPIFDAFFATMVPMLHDLAKSERLTQNDAALLLDRIGPARGYTYE